MKTIKKHITKILLATLIVSWSCDNVDFGDTNFDPNNPSKLSVNALLAGAEKSIPVVIDATTPMLYVQYLTNGQYNGEAQYQTLNWSYDYFYTTPLQNLNAIIDLNTNSTSAAEAQSEGGNNNNQIAVAKILRVYFLQTMTNRWGMIPYSEANKGLGENGNVYPKFDSQEEIYRGLFAELNDALSKINGGSGPAGDYMLGGDMTKWKEFGNSLKLVMALRLSRRNSDLGDLPKTMFNEAVNSGSLITSSGQNVYYPYLSSDLNDNPWDDRFETRKDYLMSDTFINILNGGTTSDLSDDDPRISKFSASPETAPNTFVGAPYGAVNSDTENYSFMNYDIIGYNGGTNNFPGVVLTAAQINFSLAEGVELGWISGTAEDYFKKGIEESMNQWGVDAADISTYLSNVTYTDVKDIALQKWIAMYMQGYDSWAEWRRFEADGNAPALNTSFGQLNGTGIIQRQGYGTGTAGSNKANYEAAVAAQGADDLDTKLWYFK